MPAQPTDPLRLRRRARTQDEIRRAAMRLFARGGFGSTTVGEIAAEAGISERTFFRYYATKADVVVDAPLDGHEPLVAALRARPAHEPAWDALVGALRTRLEFWRERPDYAAEVFAMLAESETVRSRLREKMHAWREQLADAVVVRLDGPAADRAVEAHALASATVGCLDAAITAWQLGSATDVDAAFERALRAVRPGEPDAQA